MFLFNCSQIFGVSLGGEVRERREGGVRSGEREEDGNDGKERGSEERGRRKERHKQTDPNKSRASDR